MAKFDIPESVKYNYMDLNNLQGMDSWDTNPSPMRASDMVNIVKKEGLHQVRHNVIQSYITGYRKLKNLCKSFFFEQDDSTGYETLYCDAPLESNQTYTLSLEAENIQNLKINPNIIEEENLIFNVSSIRNSITFTTKDLDYSQYVDGKGWKIAFTDESTKILNDIKYSTSMFNFVFKKGTTFYVNLPNNFKSSLIPMLNNRYYSSVEDINYGLTIVNDETQKTFDLLQSTHSTYYGDSVYKAVFRYSLDGEKTNDIYSYQNDNRKGTSNNKYKLNLPSSYVDYGTLTIANKFSVKLSLLTRGYIVYPESTTEKYKLYLDHILKITVNTLEGYIEGEDDFLYEYPLRYDLIETVSNANKSETKTTSLTWPLSRIVLNGTKTSYNQQLIEVDDWSSLNDIISKKLSLQFYFRVGIMGQSDPRTSIMDLTRIPLFATPVDNLYYQNNGLFVLSKDTTHSISNMSFTDIDANETLKYIKYDDNNFYNNYSKVQLELGNEATDFFDSYIEGDDIFYDIKYVGKIEEYDENGNPIPYYIKISEYMGELNKEDDSELVISVWPTPLVKNIKYDLQNEQGFEKYKISSKRFHFTNYGVSGNRQGLYEHIQFDGKERVFTPIGILSFNCSTTETEDGYYQLNFEVENILDNPYVPTIGYGSTPNGLDYSTYEAINLLSDKRKVQFLSDGTSKEYKLPETNLEDYCKIQILQKNGVFAELNEGFSLNKTKGIITFNTAPSKSPVDGRDNIIVEYAKKPTSAIEANDFTLDTTSSDNILKANIRVIKSANTNDNTKINAQLEITIAGGSSFDKSIYTINTANLKIVAGSIDVYNIVLTAEQLRTINGGSNLTITENVIFNNDGAVDNRRWTTSLTADYTKNTYKQITTNVAGSKQGDKSFSTQRKTALGFSWIGLEYNAKAVATVGSKTNGSDSYWDVYVWVRLWVSKASYLQTRASTLYGVVDGSRIEAGSTGNMYGSSTVYPSNGLSVRKRIPYSSSKKSVSVGAYLKFGSTTNLSGVNYNEMSVGNTTLTLPSITLPKTVTTTSGEKTNGSTTASTSFNETIVTGKDAIVKYDNVVPGSARLACYYGAKCVTVYGYESDRRVFLSDGTNCDTYSGVTLDGSSSITYFPDTNYRVLGEDTEIIGYAQKDGYLFTFKRGDDSVYVRYGTTLNDVTEFPSAVVTRNLQVLTRPIQINDEILLITREGVKGMSYVSQECRTELRSYFISNYFKLSADYDYDKMQWFKDDSLLHIFLNEYEFTADMVSKSYVQEGTATTGGRYSSTLAFQYEWYVNKIDWLGNEPPCVSVYQPKDFERQSEGIVYEYQREIGYNNKGVFEFSYNDYKVDKLMKISNDELKTIYKPIKAHYITPFLNMDAINVAKTVKYVYINTRSKNNDMFAIGYIDENGYQETLQKVYNNISDFRTKLKNSEIPFPKLIQIKSKIRKFMNIKLYVQNRAELEDVNTIDAIDEPLYGNTTFDRILIQYQIAGKYRGE